MMTSFAEEEEGFTSFSSVGQDNVWGEREGEEEGMSGGEEIELDNFDVYTPDEVGEEMFQQGDEEGFENESLLGEEERGGGEGGEGEGEGEGEEKPLPWFHLCLIYGVLASDALTFLIIQPLGPDQCAERFGMADDPGLCSGILVGAFIFGVALAAIPLGHVADLYGRKGVMMLGLLTAAISAISYGLANNFWVAFFLRFFGGVTNANVVMTSASCADLTTGKQRVLAFAYLWGIFAVSSALAGASAGIFADPKRQLFTYHDNRFFFPLFVVGMANIVTLVMVFFFLPETNKFAGEGGENKEGDEERGEEREKEEEHLGIVDKIKLGFGVVAADKLQQLIVVCYCVNSFGNSGVLTTIVLFFQEGVDKRGLGLEDLGYGIMLAIYSLIGITFQLLFFKKVTTFFKSNYGIYILSMILFVLGCLLSPFSVVFYLFGESQTTQMLSSVLATFTLAPISIAGMMALSILSTMQSNITHPSRQGFSLGVLQSTSCFARSFGPVVMGAIFDALGGVRLASATFWLCGCVYFSCLLMIRRMTEEDKWRTQESRFEKDGEVEKKFEEVEDSF